MTDESARATPGWRIVTALDEPNLAQDIGRCAARAWVHQSETLSILRSSPTLLMFSDYSGTHKGALFDTYAFLATTPSALGPFLAAMKDLRAGGLGMQRRMSYKSLNDTVRAQALPHFLDVANQLLGLVMTFSVDKGASGRLSEEYRPEPAFGSLGTWKPRAFRKLTTIGNLAGILIEGIRGEGQDLIWFTDADDIAPNEHKHREATRLLGHMLSVYVTSQMGHIRFGTSASDPGDLSIEDLLAVPDLAAGCLGEVLAQLEAHPQGGSVVRLFVPAPGNSTPRFERVVQWLSEADARLQKVNVVLDEHSDGCSVRALRLVSDLRYL